jgi:hypothetical protein
VGGAASGGTPSVVVDRESCAPGSALSANALWTGFGLYGYEFRPGYFGFSPDGRVLESTGHFQTQYEAETGAVIANGDLLVNARDRAWQRELSAGQVLEVESRRVLLEGGAYPIATLSGDGRYFFWVDGGCAEGTLGIHRRSVDTSEQQALSLSKSCDNAGEVTLVATSSGSAALLSNGTGRLWHADFEAAAVSSFAVESVGDGIPRRMSINLSPDDRFVATLGRENLLRTFSYPAFEPILTDIPCAWVHAFSDCYCPPIEFAPVAWSHDGSLLVSPDTEGHAVIRRACDGEILTTLDRLDSTSRARLPARVTDRGPLFLAFTPDDAGIAAAYEAHLVYYALERTGY